MSCVLTELRVGVLRILALLLLGVLSFIPRTVIAEALGPLSIGVWNGYNQHLNVVECGNLGVETTLKITALSNSAEVIGELQATLQTNETKHFILNQFPIENAYGTFRIEVIKGIGENLHCTTSMYRFANADAGEQLEYAFSLPLLDGQLGETAGVFNSIHANVNAPPVLNWLSIYNRSSESFSATVEVYAQDGSRDERQSFRVEALEPGRRQDVALGHEQGKVVGLYRIIPDKSSQAYGAFLTRYGFNESATRFNYAFPLTATQASCDLEAIHASTMANATNWGEIANPSETDAEVSVELFSRDGVSLYKQSGVRIPARSQLHLPLHEYLGPNNVGSLHVDCTGKSRPGVLVQSVFYGHSASSSEINWVYAAQAYGETAQAGDTVATLFNTFMQAANWNKILNASTSTQATNYRVFSSNSEALGVADVVTPGNGTSDYGIHADSGYDATGIAQFSVSDSRSALSSEVIRVYPKPDGEIGYILNIRNRILPGGVIAPDQLDSDKDGITDVVEIASGLDPFDARDAALDLDGDRVSNLDEFRNGTEISVHDSTFSGDARSLDPYFSQLTRREVAHLTRKIALSDQRLLDNNLQNYSSEQVFDLLFSEDFFAHDLRDMLLEFRDSPGNVQEKIAGIPVPIGEPIIALDNPLTTPEQIREAWDALLPVVSGRWHNSQAQNVFGPEDMRDYLLTRARYDSPIQSILAHLWAGHFGTSIDEMAGPRVKFARQWTIDVLYNKGLGSFKELIIGSDNSVQGCLGSGSSTNHTRTASSYICDFATSVYLHNTSNKKDGPNEDFAREFMELGVLNPHDPWTKVPNYDEETVRSATRFFSGYTHYVSRKDNPDYDAITNPDVPQFLYGSYFVYYNPSRHDEGEYRVFSGLPAETTASFTPREFASHTIEHHPGVARFIAGKLFSMLVYPDPPEEVVTRAADMLKNEANWNIKSFLRRLASSKAMFSERARQRNCVMEPFKAVTKFSRALGVPYFQTTMEGTNQWGSLRYRSKLIGNYIGSAVAGMGERLLMAPTVFSYDYCGRYPMDGVDGSSQWLKPSLLLNRHKKMVGFLEEVRHYATNHDAYEKARERILLREGSLEPHAVISYMQEIFDVALDHAEKDVLYRYLISENSSSQPDINIWRPEDDSFWRKKYIGLGAIFFSLPQSNIN